MSSKNIITKAKPIIAKLQESLEKIRKKGYRVSQGEREPNAYSVVAPVWDASNRVIASLSISGPNFRLTDKQLKMNIRGVLSAAKGISYKLGHIEKQQRQGD